MLFDASEKVKRVEMIIKLCGVYHSVVWTVNISTKDRASNGCTFAKCQPSQWQRE